MPSAKFIRKLYSNREVKRHAELHKLWHLENPDCSPLCMRPNPARFWDGGAPKNGADKQTTVNPKYVTCKRCLKLMKERGIVVNESA